MPYQDSLSIFKKSMKLSSKSDSLPSISQPGLYMDFKYVPESPGYEDPAKPKIFTILVFLLSVSYMDITLSELGS